MQRKISHGAPLYLTDDVPFYDVPRDPAPAPVAEKKK